MSLDRKKLALIHIIKKDLGLSDDQYRDILFQAVGVRSAKDLTEKSFHKLMKHFVRSAYYRKSPSAITLKQKMYIEYLAKKLDWTQEHLINFIHKYYHKTDIDYLSKKDAAHAIEGLKNISFRQK
ncbi:MAG: phage protein GemA/Gp16 family protein [Candidatus Omnitrophota bacterium]